MAAANGPDVIGLLHDKTSYGVYGDHGGAQEAVQRVPMVFWSPNLAFANTTGGPFRTPDILPTDACSRWGSRSRRRWTAPPGRSTRLHPLERGRPGVVLRAFAYAWLTVRNGTPVEVSLNDLRGNVSKETEVKEGS